MSQAHNASAVQHPISPNLPIVLTSFIGRQREIAEELVLSKRTVEKHIGSILSKLEMTSRAQIVRWAIAQGLLKDSPSQ